MASYPIKLDPTIYINKTNYDGGFLRDTNGSVSAFTNPSSSIYDSVYHSDDGKGNTILVINRAYLRWNITTYQNHTIYGTCEYWQKNSAISARQKAAYRIVDWYSLATDDWNYTYVNDFGVVSSSVGWQKGANSIKNPLILAKHEVPPAPEVSTNRIVAIVVKATDETAGTIGNSGQFEYYNTTTDYPYLTFSSYDTFTQNAPTAGDAQVTVSWVNGEGLVTGDKHRIYYCSGTGYTAQQIIDNNTYVESSAYSDTSMAITGLTNDTTYSFVVVDMQNVGGIFYAGARSSIQTATPTNTATFPLAVTINYDTEWEAYQPQAPQGDTQRKARKAVTVNMDTKRSMRQVIAATFDTYRKLRNTITVNAAVRGDYPS